MNGISLVQALRAERETLALRWCRRVRECRAARGMPPVDFDVSLAGALIDEAAHLIEHGRSMKIPRRHDGAAFRHLDEFPRNVSLCIEIFEAGAQAVGGYVIENSGTTGFWSRPVRNRYIGELDAVFHVLVHREIQGLCEASLRADADWLPKPGRERPAGIVTALIRSELATLRN